LNARPVVVRDARRVFGATVALAGVSLEVAQGEMVGIIGPDGAGKTTLLRVVCGLEKVDAGLVRLFGADPYRDRRVPTASIGYLSQRFSLYGDLSVDENIEFFARLHGVRAPAARRDRLLELTGLRPFRARLADRLSGGMKQKLALACTLVHEPPLLILDEPTTGVDPVSRREFWKLLAEFLSQGLTIVLATPYLDEAERCRHVALLHEGRLLAFDKPDHLRAGLPGSMLEIVTSEARRALDAVAAQFGSDRVELFGDRLHLRVTDHVSAADVVAGLTRAGFSDVRARVVTPSLEDVFIDTLVTERRAADSIASAVTRQEQGTP
jgi:ABC-2 type transport system ATP-binding protein